MKNSTTPASVSLIQLVAVLIALFAFLCPINGQINDQYSCTDPGESIEGSPNEKSKITEIDTIYYLPDSTKFIPHYVVLDEIYQPHCKFEVNKNWVFYKVKEVHYLFSHHVIDDTLMKIGFYKDTLKTKLYEQFINEKLDSSDVYPFWYKVMVDSQMPVIQGEIELPYGIIGVADLCFPNNLTSYSGRSLGFHEMSQTWIVIPDFPVKIIVEHTVTSVDNGAKKLSNYILDQNYPNPFNPVTTIRYSIPKSEKVSIKVHDLLGREVALLLNEEQTAGFHEVKFDASNLASGTYIYRIVAGDFVQSRKMILMK